MAAKRPCPLSDSASIVSALEESDQKRRRTSPSHLSSCRHLDLFTYFRELPHDSDFETLFGDVVVVLALFRSLDDVGKIIVTRILCLPEPSRWEPFLVWLRGNRKEAIRALNSLRALHILSIRPKQVSWLPTLASPSQNSPTGTSRPSDDGSASVVGSITGGSVASAGSRGRARVVDARYELHPTFRRTLQLGIVEGFQSSAVLGERSNTKAAKHFPTRATLQSHAAQQWNNMLQWLCEGASVDEQSSGTQRLGRLGALCRGQVTPPRPPGSADMITVLQHLRLAPSNSCPPEQCRPAEDLPNETFQWLLLDIRSQVLSICVNYLHCVHFGLIGRPSSASCLVPASTTPAPADVTSRERTEVLRLLFSLAEAQIGQPCSMSELSASQVPFINLAYDIGLVWMHKPRGAKHFFPTPFAKLLQSDGPEMAHLTSSMSTLTALGANSVDSPLAASLDLPSNLYHAVYSQFFVHEQLASYPPELKDPEGQGQRTPSTNHAPETGVIVESNFKVFAYTVSSLLMTVVARLCEIRVITPSLVVGNLSRDSVLEAYKSGVTADQIIRFFSAHAHPSIYTKARREGKAIIPENVSTQLRIWESERRRVRMRRACVFEFSKESDLDVFPLAVSKAGAGWLLMHTDIPPSSNPTSKEEWRLKVIEKLRGRPPAGEVQRAVAPVLAVQAQHKEEMTAFIRSSMRNLKR